MSELTASAPGKLVLLGEYAVLEGAPALALAINRRAQVRIVSRTDGVCSVSAPDLDIADARMSIDGEGELHWQCTPIDASKLTLFEQVWQGLSHEGQAPLPGHGPGHGFSVWLDTSGFFHAGDSGANNIGRAKLGLGSSAALTVALAGAFAAFAGHATAMSDRPHWLRRLLHMHGTWQAGRGSGVDVAASVAGGLIAYQLIESESIESELTRPNVQPSLESLVWPIAGLHSLFVWSGEAVSTADSLRRMDAWRHGHRDDYVAHMRELGALAEQAVDVLRRGQAKVFVALVAAYAHALHSFGTACGLQIFSTSQQRVARLAAREQLSYKPCGAGGDFGVVFATDVERLRYFEQRLAGEGLRCIPLTVDSAGFTHTMHSV